MLSHSDLIAIPIPYDLIQAGATHACQNRPDLSGRQLSVFIQHAMIRSACRLALQHYLEAEEIPYRTRQSTPFSDPTTRDIYIGGRRCILDVSSKQLRRGRSKWQEEIYKWLTEPVSLSTTALKTKTILPTDLILFSWLVRNGEEASTAKPSPGSQNLFTRYIYPLPLTWHRIHPGQTHNPLQVISWGPASVSLLITGISHTRSIISERLELLPQVLTETNGSYERILYLSLEQSPVAKIRLLSQVPQLSLTILTRQWIKILLDVESLILAGYIPWQAMTESLVRLPQSVDHRHTHHQKEIKSMLQYRALDPLKPLFEKAKNW